MGAASVENHCRALRTHLRSLAGVQFVTAIRGYSSYREIVDIARRDRTISDGGDLAEAPPLCGMICSFWSLPELRTRALGAREEHRVHH